MTYNLLNTNHIMRKFLFIVVVTILCGNISAQTRTSSNKSSMTTSASKVAASAAKAKEDTKLIEEAKIKAEEESKAAQAEKEKRDSTNMKCNFNFTTASFVSNQNPINDFVIYEVPNMQASVLKAAVYTTLSTLYKSPKDVITSISDNMIQLEGYAKGVYRTTEGTTSYGKDLLFDLVIQFKDGKIRYNIPTIKMIYSEWPLSGMARLNMELPLSKLIDDRPSRLLVEKYFNELISMINSNIVQSNNW